MSEQEQEIDDLMQKNTRYRVTKNGHEITCLKGLWDVCAPTKEDAIREAGHYFYQYYLDGEYDN